MKTTRALLVLVILLGAGYFVTAQDQMFAPKPTATAVVDVSALLEGLDAKLQVEADLQARLDTGNADLKAREEQIRQLQADLKLMTPSTDAYEAKREEFDYMVVELQTAQSYQKQKINREYSRQFGQLYRSILAAIERVATTNGFDVVLFKEQQEVDFGSVPREQLAAFISGRKVLYSAGSLDITDQVRTLMNNEFRSAGN